MASNSSTISHSVYCIGCGMIPEPHIRPPSTVYRSYCNQSAATYAPPIEVKYKGRTYTCSRSLEYQGLSRVPDILPYLGNGDRNSSNTLMLNALVGLRPIAWWQAQCTLRDLDTSGTLDELCNRLREPGHWQLGEYQRLNGVTPTRQTTIEKLEQRFVREWRRRNDEAGWKCWVALSAEEQVKRNPSRVIKEGLGIEVKGQRKRQSKNRQKFTLFTKLPPEIRDMIWKFAMPSVDTVVVLDRPNDGNQFAEERWTDSIKRTVREYGLRIATTEPYHAEEGTYVRVQEFIEIDDDLYHGLFDGFGLLLDEDLKVAHHMQVFTGTGFKDQFLIAATDRAIRKKVEKTCNAIEKWLNPAIRKELDVSGDLSSVVDLSDASDLVEFHEDDFSDDEHIRATTTVEYNDDDFSDDEHVLASITP